MADERGQKHGDPDFDYYPDSDLSPEWLTEYYDDVYEEITETQNEDLLQDLYGTSSSFSLEEVLEHCIEPTLYSATLHVGKLIALCLIFRLTTQIVRPPKWLCHSTSAVTGVLALFHFFHLSVVYPILLAFISYLAIHFGSKLSGQSGVSTTAICLTFNSICELVVSDSKEWHQIRGAQMILTMKAISVAFDYDEEKTKKSSPSATSNKKTNVKRQDVDITAKPSVLEYFGFALCPGTCVFGPWTTYKDYMKIFESPHWNFQWCLKLISSLVLANVFLTVSTCWLPTTVPDNSWIWWVAYRDAASFRASHFFVSFISEASAVASGLGFNPSAKTFQLPVVKPLDVEIPRSLTEVVRSWNIPMHTWLKNYCFKKTQRYGVFIAVLSTYCASTILHGLNFQLGAVLLSLGFFTFAEHRLRSNLANKFNASVDATPGKARRWHENRAIVVIVNFAFGMLACVNLVYLGVMFDQSHLMEEGYSWRHTIAKWSGLSFASHWIMMVVLLLSFVT